MMGGVHYLLILVASCKCIMGIISSAPQLWKLLLSHVIDKEIRTARVRSLVRGQPVTRRATIPTHGLLS